MSPILPDRHALRAWARDSGVMWPDTPFDVLEHLHLLAWRGSKAHGTWMQPEDPNSIDDIDLIGVVVPPPEYVMGLSNWENAQAQKGPDGLWDIELHSLQKFCRMLLQQNPNILCAVWHDVDKYLFLSDVGQDLIRQRDLFADRKRAHEAFCGYANGQLHKMTAYVFNGRMGAKRKALVDKFGFDRKNSVHLIRILRQGVEFLKSGRIQVDRTGIDAAELIEIKTGEGDKWPLSRVRSVAEDLFKQAHEAYENSPLPEKPDLVKINALLVELMKRGLRT